MKWIWVFFSTSVVGVIICFLAMSVVGWTAIALGMDQDNFNHDAAANAVCLGGLLFGFVITLKAWVNDD